MRKTRALSHYDRRVSRSVEGLQGKQSVRKTYRLPEHVIKLGSSDLCVLFYNPGGGGHHWRAFRESPQVFRMRPGRKVADRTFATGSRPGMACLSAVMYRRSDRRAAAGSDDLNRLLFGL
jgi:hypothetical protein